MTEAEQPAIQITTANRRFEGHKDSVSAVAVFPDRRRMVTASYDGTLRLWDLEEGAVLKIMKGHCNEVAGIAVSGDGQWIASGDFGGEVIAWNRDGEPLTQLIKVHSNKVFSLDFSPDSTFLASGSFDTITKLWSTKTWRVQGDPINCGPGSGAQIFCVRYSPSGEYLAIATKNDIQIWNPRKSQRIVKFQGHSVFNRGWNYSLAWTPDSKQLVSAGSTSDPTIRIWDSSTWQQVGEPCKGHTDTIYMVALNPTGTLIASASEDQQVHLWRLSDRRTIAIFKHPNQVYCVTFSADGKHIFSGGRGAMISKWAVPFLEDIPEDQVSVLKDPLREDTLEEHAANDAQQTDCEILAINTTARNACITGDLPTAVRLFTQEINADGNDYNSYANRSFVKARNSDWDCALDDALKSISIQPSLIGCVSEGIALCGKRQFQDAMKAFDIASMYVDADLNKTRLLLLIKAIALFNANQRDEAILRVQVLTTTRPNPSSLACGIVEAYLHMQLGMDALDYARHNEAADHFTAAVNTIGFPSMSAIHSRYDIFVVLFGWDLKSLWQTAHQNRCNVLLRAGRLPEAIEAYRYMMDRADEATKARCIDWSTAFTQDCGMLYTAAIDLDFATDTIFANRSKARSGEMLWDGALLDVEKVIKVNPSSYFGYQLKHAVLHGAHRYDEAIDAFQTMLSKLENAPDTQTQKLRQQYVNPSEVKGAIQQTVKAQLDDAPHRLLDTFTGRLCDREAQINAFITSTEYKEILSSKLMHVDLRMEHIKDVVAMYFRCVTLSHRWEGKEPLLHDVQDKVVDELNPVDGIMKLQSFCKTARAAGYRWGWIDSCCIDQANNVELQTSLNSMFVWYRTSALTMVYLSDVPPSSKPGALAKSAWNTRGWTVPEFLAPKVIRFYQSDWTPYLDDCSPNHKQSVAIMQELEDATGIDAQILVAFRPGMINAREKLQWASTRVTAVEEDIAYSLFGIFGVQLPIMYGEKKQKALGRLLQEIIAESGDITALDWVGTSSEFNSCLPADITSYEAPPYKLPSISEDEMPKLVSSLKSTVTVESALKMYSSLDCLSAPRFAHRRLHLPCNAFPITEVRRRFIRYEETYFTYEVKADGLRDLEITTENKLLQFSRGRPARPGRSFLLVRPWDRRLQLSDYADDTESMYDFTLPSPWPIEQCPVDSDSSERAMRLIIRLGQPFSAFLLAQQRGGEYKRIASDRDIIAQVKDVNSVQGMTDVRTLEIL
ncbi:uncharacterized protein HD556DRAFT_1028494 [Suillus plorans]|uniref:Heterokaryon incompatibility domain-containing protein n=1 Tax=Suillus plorans TaxID=116603 RepID=A0A9P7J340_9AGAM|nr:uncharacterized protein HD556DRAFT_1028494 [Suillus plorans]KAG1800334.1 hypothetical protein HD556DRAFT_1028494 [Suillus plorans]